MKTLYSSTFLSILFGFMLLMGGQKPITLPNETGSLPVFSNIATPKIPAKGRPLIQVFDSYACKTCDRFISETLPLVKQELGKSGQADLRIYVVQGSQNPEALLATLSLKCAADQKRFWDMHTQLHQTDEPLNEKNILAMAKGLNMDTKKLQGCMASDQHLKSIEEDRKTANDLGVTKFPTLIINGYRLTGNQPIENIMKIIRHITKFKS